MILSGPPRSDDDDPAAPMVAPDRMAAIVLASFDSAPDGLVVFDASHRQVAFNRCFLSMWNFPADMVQRRDTAEMQAFMAAQLVEPDRYVEQTRQPVVDDTGAHGSEFTHRDGRVLERRASLLAVQGLPGAIVIRWRDISEQRRAEQQLRLVQARLSAVFEHALDAILLTDDEGRYVDANPAACALLERPRQALLGLQVADVVNAPRSALEAAWTEFLRNGSSSGQVELRTGGGELRVARFSAVANIQDGLHLSILSDITDEARAQRQLKELTEQMDVAMSNASIVFWGVDLLADAVWSSNPEWLAVTLGYGPGELEPGIKAWDALVHPDDVSTREAVWRAHVEGRSPTYEAEFRMRRKDGQWEWLHARGRAIERDSAGRATRIVGIRVNITRRKQAELLLQQQAYTDSLTGALNRSRFLALADAEMSRALRHEQAIAVLMIDLDHFKAINDSRGHAGGDAVLQSFVRTAQQVMRGSDSFGRIGGEEFAALLPQTDLAGATTLAQRLLALVHAHPASLADGAPVPYTVSIGVAARPPLALDQPLVHPLMVAADRALYQAKRDGRDRVRVAPPG
jgi:diguanylate cyclase (GGDEF)-like protein/PAS domain S-box-containing protein